MSGMGRVPLIQLSSSTVEDVRAAVRAPGRLSSRMQQPSTQSVYDLFNGRIQFVVPVYQRAYVWTANQNWSVMWDDIADTADRYLANPEAHLRQKHFLGPIVLEQQHYEPGGVDPRLVIDGQQRLTTLQIVLSAAADVAKAYGVEDVVDELTELAVNRGRSAKGNLRYTVWPSRRDRSAFLGVMDGDHLAATDGIPGAWHFFRTRIDDWVTDEGEATAEQRVERLRALQVCLDSLLYVVSINLDESDNAQVIFETLNARGTGLGALDLVKNATFLQAQREGAPAEHLHDHHWEPTFEADDYWMEEIRQGRERRVRADWFLMHWLAMELGLVVRADNLFDTFRKDLLRPDGVLMSELVPRLCEDARVMRSFDDFEKGTPEELFFARLEAMDTTTMLPIALLLFRSTELGADRRRRALWALESWLVRRAVLRLTSKNYNRLLTSLLREIKKDVSVADEAIVRELRTSQATTAVWPSDEAVRSRLERGDLYGYVGQRGSGCSSRPPSSTFATRPRRSQSLCPVASRSSTHFRSRGRITGRWRTAPTRSRPLRSGRRTSIVSATSRSSPSLSTRHSPTLRGSAATRSRASATSWRSAACS